MASVSCDSLCSLPNIDQTEEVSFLSRQIKTKIEELRDQNQIGWQEQAARFIRSLRKSDPEQELERLRAVGVLDDEIESRLENQSDHVKALFAQAKEIQNVYQDTHYCFFHGQPSHLIYVPHLLKELEKRRDPEANLRQFKVLRPFNDVDFDITKYSNSKLGDVFTEGATCLLSVDASMLNKQKFESAVHFVAQNMPSRRKVNSLILELMQELYPKASISELNDCLEHIKSAVPKAPCGNLFLICIPKDQSQKVVFRSHAFGVPCDCPFASEPIEELQNNLPKRCIGGTFPQYRIFMPEIRPGKNQHIFLLTPLDKPVRKQFKEIIRKSLAALPE